MKVKWLPIEINVYVEKEMKPFLWLLVTFFTLVSIRACTS